MLNKTLSRRNRPAPTARCPFADQAVELEPDLLRSLCDHLGEVNKRQLKDVGRDGVPHRHRAIRSRARAEHGGPFDREPGGLNWRVPAVTMQATIGPFT
jgi:hypothetical protein